jgi:hypothetical protein
MTVDALPTPVRVRMFRVTFRPNLDGPESDDIPLGVFGDLRMGERYAVGLIARSAGEHAEVARVGRLAKVVVARPYDALQQMHAAVWRTPDPATAFEAMVTQCYSSVVFSDPVQANWTISPAAEFAADATVDHVRTWCKEQLRRRLRFHFLTWIGDSGSPHLEEAA